MLDKTQHVSRRIHARLRKHGIPFDTVEQEMQAIVEANWHPKRSYAVKVKNLKQFFGQSQLPYYEREESNGEILWVIIRNNDLVTFFFRRRNQPTTPQRFAVDEITSAYRLMNQEAKQNENS